MECHESTSDLVLSVVRAVSRLFSVYEVVNNFERGFHAKKSVILVRRSKPVTAKIDLEGKSASIYEVSRSSCVFFRTMQLQEIFSASELIAQVATSLRF